MEYLRYDIGSISNIIIDDGMSIPENDRFFSISNHMTTGELELLKDFMWCPSHYDLTLAIRNRDVSLLLKESKWTIICIIHTLPIAEIVIDVVGTRDQLLLFKLSMPLSPISHGVVS